MKNLEKFESDDILYHYTKTTIALEHILYNKKLRLSDRKKSRDPIENMIPFFSRGYVARNSDESEYIMNQTYDNATGVVKSTIERIKQVKQVCFCMNNIEGRFNEMKNKPYEFYGCMKPRMWEQYADNYNGVCLIFSKAELLKQIGEDYLYSNIKYLNYQNLEYNDNRIDLNNLIEFGSEHYRQMLFSKMDKDIFNKHEDYIGENEFRICTYSNESILEINIEKALKGIIVSNLNSEFFKNKLMEYGEEYDIEILHVNWDNSGVRVDNRKQTLELIREINEGIISKNNNGRK